jgi:Uma2 family endonuclease
MERMGNPALAPDERFTYRHYRTWPDSERWELIDGHAWAMSPAPRTRHQEILGRLFTSLREAVKGRPCKAFIAPFDVLVPDRDESDDEVATVIQPDISVFCDRSKIGTRGARGAPDLVIEILSPSTSKKDLNEKFGLYERHGVKEYWVVDPGNYCLQVWRLGPNGRYGEEDLRDLLQDASPIASALFPDFRVDLKELFHDLD